VTCICEGLRKEIIGRGVASDDVTVIPNAVDVERFQVVSNKPHVAEASGRAFRIGFIGSFYRYEGLDILLRAAAELKLSGVPIDIVLVGGGPEEDALKLLATQLNLEDVVTFTGRVDNSEVSNYYRSLDALVYPRRSSRLTEMVTPLKPLEAMANGKLVLATDIGGHRELVADQRTGLLCLSDDVESLAALIKKAHSKPHLRREIASNGLRFVQTERTWEDSVSRYAGVYSG
jgi:glycosyltransferase involved in cell wall biosynthesis